jgi:CheY-like chemotaxis protein
MGIGLTLVRSIVEMHNGRISAHSDGPKLGSEFVLRLPRLEAVSEPAKAACEEALSIRGDGRVVIIEDQDDARFMLRSLLEMEGYEVHDAENGINGLALIQRIHPDVALIDIGLPGIDGYELARRLRASQGENHTYLVALTGYGQSTDVNAAREAGFDHHIVKPINLKKLSRILQFRSGTDTEGAA